MLVDGINYRTIKPNKELSCVEIIDQTALPFEFIIKRLETLGDVIESIISMRVRGAPLIGVSAAYGIALAMNKDASNHSLEACKKLLINSRPTAVNLSWAVNLSYKALVETGESDRIEKAWEIANNLAEEDVDKNKLIGTHGFGLLKRHGSTINILTHCNAGWLATIDHGTALSPIYKAVSEGLDIHVWVDETRPRNQGLSLTAWELNQANVRHTVISDNAGGFLMQEGRVDCVLVGADRVSMDGSVCNKIGTYLKAIAAKQHNIPFYVAAPLSTVDFDFKGSEYTFDIECRGSEEIMKIKGRDSNGKITEVTLGNFPAYNPAFDITPSEFVTKIICEEGVIEPNNIGSFIL
jgi:methylthioribose-1-phosphate isomerase